MANEEKKPRFSSIVVDGVKYKTLLTERYRNRPKYTEHDPSKIRAFIPGTIDEIFIKNKRKVKEGEIVLILHAMKMMNSVTSPMDGEVKLHVKVGDIVTKNQVLFEIS